MVAFNDRLPTNPLICWWFAPHALESGTLRKRMDDTINLCTNQILRTLELIKAHWLASEPHFNGATTTSLASLTSKIAAIKSTSSTRASIVLLCGRMISTTKVFCHVANVPRCLWWFTRPFGRIDCGQPARSPPLRTRQTLLKRLPLTISQFSGVALVFAGVHYRDVVLLRRCYCHGMQTLHCGPWMNCCNVRHDRFQEDVRLVLERKRLTAL